MRVVMLLVSSPSEVPGATLMNHKAMVKELGRKVAEQAMLDECKGADIVFIQFQRAGHLSYEFLDKLDGFRIAWTGDVRGKLQEFQKELYEHVDLMTFVSGENVTEGLNYGPTEYLDIWYYNNTFTPISRMNKWDVCFMANNYKQFPLSTYRAKMARHLQSVYGARFCLVGWRWGTTVPDISNNHTKQNVFYNQSKIAINISNYRHSMYSSDRILRILGSGVMCITHDYPDMPYEDGVHLRVFKTMKQLEVLINYYTHYNEEREAIAKAGHELALKRDSKDVFVDKLVKLKKHHTK